MIIEVGIIKPVEESEWIIPMVVQDNKTGTVIGISLYHRLPSACQEGETKGLAQPTYHVQEISDR